MSIETEIEELNNTKVAIAQAIQSKGRSTLGKEFSEYAPEIVAIEGGGGSSDWMRPDDWLSMPTSVVNTIDILAAVYNSDSNYCALSIDTDGVDYTVDWGDGNIEVFADNVKAEHQYDYSDTDLDGTESTRGYKQTIISISTTGTIAAFDLGQAYTRTDLNLNNPWLDIQVNAPNATAMAYRGTSTAYDLEVVNIISIGELATLYQTFMYCYSLQSVVFPDGSLVSVTTLQDAFYNCYSLQSVVFPAGSLVFVTTLYRTFMYCYSLQSVVFPAGSLVSVTTLQDAFYSCSSLQSVVFPAGSLVSVTTLYRTFNSCYSLQSVVFPAGSLVSVTTLQQTFNSCYSLQSVVFPVGSLVFVTTLQQTFYNCSSLQSVVFPDGSLVSVTTLYRTFYNCYSLQSVVFPAGSLVSVTTLYQTFYNCSSLQSVVFPAGSLVFVTTLYQTFYSCYSLQSAAGEYPVSVDFINCGFGALGIIAVFNTLPTIGGQTITISQNHGLVDLTTTDREIATNKGWTIAE